MAPLLMALLLLSGVTTCGGSVSFGDKTSCPIGYSSPPAYEPACPNWWPAAREKPAKELGKAGPPLLARRVGNCPSHGAGDPELVFCKKFQDLDAHPEVSEGGSCCSVVHDQALAAYSDMVLGSGYMRAHVLLNAFFCLPCHPRVGCMYDAPNHTLHLPAAFVDALASEVGDFSKTALKPVQGDACDLGGDIVEDGVVSHQNYGVDGAAQAGAVRATRAGVLQLLSELRPPGTGEYGGSTGIGALDVKLAVDEGDRCHAAWPELVPLGRIADDLRSQPSTPTQEEERSAYRAMAAGGALALLLLLSRPLGRLAGKALEAASACFGLLCPCCKRGGKKRPKAKGVAVPPPIRAP